MFLVDLRSKRMADGQANWTFGSLKPDSERKQFEMQLTHAAFHDELTGLANRALCREPLIHALARIRVQ